MNNKPSVNIAALAHERRDTPSLIHSPCLLYGLVKDILASIGVIALIFMALWVWAGAV